MPVCVYISLCVGGTLALAGQSTALDVILQDAIRYGFVVLVVVVVVIVSVLFCFLG